MKYFVDVILEKHAGALKDLKSWYTKTKASPIFKAKKALGYTALAAAPVLYMGHKMTQPPDRAEPGSAQGVPAPGGM